MNKDIIVYTSPTWPHCHTVKEFLSRKGVSFTEYDVVKNEQARDEMVKKTGRMAVPTIMAGNEVVVGFNQAELEKLIH